MTDNEIIKALACCKSSRTILACHKCPARRNRDCGGSDVNVSSVLLVEVLTLLNSLKAENERLTEEANRYKRYYFNHEYDKIKSEARKEFAEMFMIEAAEILEINTIYWMREIKNKLLAEMEERE